MKYDDLLTVPYKRFGRDKDGMDCYGLLIEMARRDGKELKDFVYNSIEVDGAEFPEVMEKINVERISAEERQAGDAVQWLFKNNLHCGYLLDKNTVLNMTFSGVRITPVMIIKNPIYIRII